MKSENLQAPVIRPIMGITNYFDRDFCIAYFQKRFGAFPSTFQSYKKITMEEITKLLLDLGYRKTYRSLNYDDSEIYEFSLLFEDNNSIVRITRNSENVIAISLYFLNQSEDIEKIIKLDEVKDEEPREKIYIIKSSSSGFYLSSVEFTVSEIDISKNYNDSFYSVNNQIKESLKKSISGLHLFHGEPGTGKSSYIKHLIQETNKKIIYCPPTLMDQISDPSFITFLMDQEDSILVIEDAERILKSRDLGGSTAITNLLNMSDGLLGDILKIQIIATFNCDISELDEALLRKGRLLNKYEFGKLDTPKAQVLLDELGYNVKANEPMTLSDIYNYQSESHKQEKVTISL